MKESCSFIFPLLCPVFVLQVPNFIPSLSAVVAEVTPERYIWRLGIAFMTSPRSLDSFIYYNLFSLTISTFFFKYLNVVLFILQWVQCLALYGLTYVSSIENYGRYS